MRRAALALALVIPACLPDLGVRARFAEVVCDDGGECWGRWDHTDAWTPVVRVEELEGGVDASTVWECEPLPDVDGCDLVDTVGHVMCWRDVGGWAPAVAPTCAVTDWSAWHTIGLDMAAWVVPGGPWG
jgi:hypothetical protein